MAPTSFPPVKQAKRTHDSANDSDHASRGKLPITPRQAHEMPPIASDSGLRVRPKTEGSQRRRACTCTRRSCLCSAPLPEILLGAEEDMKDTRTVRLKSVVTHEGDESPTEGSPESPTQSKTNAGEERKCFRGSTFHAPQFKTIAGRRETRRRSTRTQKLVMKFMGAKAAVPRLSCIGEDEDDEEDEFEKEEEPAKVPGKRFSVRSSLKALDDLRVTAYGATTFASPGRRTSAKSCGENSNLGELNRMPETSGLSLPGIASDLSSFMQGAFKASASAVASVAKKRSSLDSMSGGQATLPTDGQPFVKRSSLITLDHDERPKKPMSARLKRVHLKSQEWMKTVRDERSRELKKRRYNSLPPFEIASIEQAFNQFDKEKRGYIDQGQIIACLKELGILGKTMEERLALKRIIECPVEGCTRQPFHWQPGKSCCETCHKHNGGCHDDECNRLCNFQKHKPVAPAASAKELRESAVAMFLTEMKKGTEKTTEEDEEVERGLSLQDFALTVLPAARQRLLDLRSDEMLKQFFQFDDDGSGQLSFHECKEVAGRLGIDQRILDSLCDNEDEVNFDQFQHLIQLGKERVDRMVRARERAIQQQLGINDTLFEDLRNDLTSLFQLFQLYDADESGALNMNEVMCMIKEFGLQPKTAQEKEEIDLLLKSNDLDGNSEFNFIEFLELIKEIRAYKLLKKHEEYHSNFDRYDKDKSGTLSILEVSNLLADLGFVPRSYREQDELAYLIHTADHDASGVINFGEFQVLCQRIDEKLKSMRYEEDIEYAMKLGFSEPQIRELRWIFDSLDEDGSGRLDMSEVRHALAMLHKKVPSDTFKSMFEALDIDGSGVLDLKEYMGFMRMMRDSEGLFSEEVEKLASKATGLETRVLKRVLEHFHLAKSYINSLEKDDLVNLFCDFMGIDCSSKLHDVLGVSTLGELFDLVAKMGESGQVYQGGVTRQNSRRQSTRC